MVRLKKARFSSAFLLRRMLAEPGLVEHIRRLPPHRLSELIHSVGLEDAGELVALATTEQLERVFDEDLWQAGEAAEESFDPQRFALWLEVLFEAGENAVVARLCELPFDFVCLAVHRLVFVLDFDVLVDEVSSDPHFPIELDQLLDNCATEEWQEFRIIDRGQGGWDVIVPALLAMDTAHSDVLRRILERCCVMTSQYVEDHGGLGRVLSDSEALEEEVRGERSERRGRLGYVSLADARGFLKLSAQRLTYSAGRDPLSWAYFRELQGPTPSSTRAQPAARPLRTAMPPLRQVVESSVEPDERESVEASLLQSSEQRPLLAALQLLAEDNPQAYALRLAELAYLANVLVSASSTADRQLRPIEATEAALWVCTRGVIVTDVSPSTQQLALDLESTELDLVFRGGWAALVVEEQTHRARSDIGGFAVQAAVQLGADVIDVVAAMLRASSAN